MTLRRGLPVTLLLTKIILRQFKHLLDRLEFSHVGPREVAARGQARVRLHVPDHLTFIRFRRSLDGRS